jgi:hypothetical protein
MAGTNRSLSNITETAITRSVLLVASQKMQDRVLRGMLYVFPGFSCFSDNFILQWHQLTKVTIGIKDYLVCSRRYSHRKDFNDENSVLRIHRAPIQSTFKTLKRPFTGYYMEKRGRFIFGTYRREMISWFMSPLFRPEPWLELKPTTRHIL